MASAGANQLTPTLSLAHRKVNGKSLLQVKYLCQEIGSGMAARSSACGFCAWHQVVVNRRRYSQPQAHALRLLNCPMHSSPKIESWLKSTTSTFDVNKDQ